MILIDLFSGIGGFALAAQQAGLEITEHYFSEIDPHAVANYRYNFPEAKLLGNITEINAKPFYGKPTIITFGSPCQDFSMAGKGAGATGNRSGLIYEAIRIVEEAQPDVFIWENVKGLLSKRHISDFASIIERLANIPGYRLEGQLCNSSWVVPQNRERFVLIGHNARRCTRNVFPITQADFGLDERNTEAATVRTLTAGGKSGGHHSGMTIIQVNTKENFGKQPKQQDRLYDITGISPKLPKSRGDDKVKIIVPPRGFNKGAYSDISGTLTKKLADNAFLYNGLRIRRLTPIEWERLQTFPDNWTKFGKKKDGSTYEIPKTYRYAMIGNAVTVSLIKILIERINL